MCSSRPSLFAPWIALLAGLALASSDAARAKVFHSQSEALELAFPDAERIDSKLFVLDEDQVSKIEALANCELESKLVRIYTGVRDDKVIGYALIDVHEVRTLPEAFMVVLNPQGRVRSLRLLAFYEPLDYKPTERWYRQFDDRSIESPLRVGGDVHGVAGATLSARATAGAVKRALAYYEILLRGGQ